MTPTLNGRSVAQAKDRNRDDITVLASGRSTRILGYTTVDKRDMRKEI